MMHVAQGLGRLAPPKLLEGCPVSSDPKHKKANKQRHAVFRRVQKAISESVDRHVGAVMDYVDNVGSSLRRAENKQLHPQARSTNAWGGALSGSSGGRWLPPLPAPLQMSPCRSYVGGIDAGAVGAGGSPAS